MVTIVTNLEEVAAFMIFQRRHGEVIQHQHVHACKLQQELADTADGQEYRDDQIVRALGTSLRSVERIRQRFVTEGLEAALNPKPQPARPDKIKIKGDLEQHLLRLACSEPPEGRDHWTLQLLADELVVLGLVASLSTETVRQALKKMTFAHGL